MIKLGNGPYKYYANRLFLVMHVANMAISDLLSITMIKTQLLIIIITFN